jgi:hypothetical protein
VIQYDRDKHEMLVVNWYIVELAGKPEEFSKLFAKPLHNLTELLFWCHRTVKFVFDVDINGIWTAAWIEPCLSGAYAGAWVREDKRHSKATLKFINGFYDQVLEHFPTLLGLTKQPDLHRLHLGLGYKFGCTIPGLFDGDDAMLYVMTKESRKERLNGRRRRRENSIEHEQYEQPVRAISGAGREPAIQLGKASNLESVEPSHVGTANGRSKRPNPKHKRIPRLIPPKRKHVGHEPAPELG